MAALREARTEGQEAVRLRHRRRGLRALDRYTLLLKLERSQPRVILTLVATAATCTARWRARWSKLRRRDCGTSGRHRTVPAGRVATLVEDRAGTQSRPIATCVYDCEPNADDAEGQALLATFKGRKLPMIDRVEISIIDERSRAGCRSCSKQQDLLERLPFDFVNIAIPNNKLAPNLARQGDPGCIARWRPT